MSRSTSGVWTRRVRKRFKQAAGQLEGETILEAALSTLAKRLRVDPAVLLGALAAEPKPAALWDELWRCARSDRGPRMSDWAEIAAAAAVVTAAAQGDRPLSCLVVEPSDIVDVYALASCLALSVKVSRLTIVATHSDALVVEIGRSGLLSDPGIRLLPAVHRAAHFRQNGHCWQVLAGLHSAIQFIHATPFQDARRHTPFHLGKFDLVVSRGLLSRMRSADSHRLATRLLRSLRNRGVLLVGPGEHDLPPLRALERCVAPGALLHCKRRLSRGTNELEADFSSLLVAVEQNPTEWEPRWKLASALLHEGYADPAIAQLREVARLRPDDAGVWRTMAQAYLLVGDTEAAEAARRRSLSTAAVASAA